MSAEVRTPDVTGALWRLPPVLCGLAASEASRPVYLSVSSLLFQKAPVAPAVAVTVPQQTPVVMAPQAVAQAPSQPVQPPQSGIAAAPGAPVVSQVCFPANSNLPSYSRALRPQGCRHCHCHSCQQAGFVISSCPDPRPQRLTQLKVSSIESLTHAHTRTRSYIHTSA